MFRGEVQEGEGWPERGETRKVWGHGHQGGESGHLFRILPKSASVYRVCNVADTGHCSNSHFGGKRRSRDDSVPIRESMNHEYTFSFLSDFFFHFKKDLLALTYKLVINKVKIKNEKQPGNLERQKID